MKRTKLLYWYQIVVKAFKVVSVKDNLLAGGRLIMGLYLPRSVQGSDPVAAGDL
jgi:hypothetical protein